MRIGMMTDMYKPYVSGVTTYLALVKQHLEKLGHEVFIITFGDHNFDDGEDNVIRSPGLPVRKKEVHFNLYHNKQARRLIRTLDIAHVHHPFFSGSFTVRFCHPRGIPIVFTHHTRYDLYARTYLPNYVGTLGESVVNYYMPDFLKKIDAMIVPSIGLKEVVEQYGDVCPIYYEPHGMDLTPFLKTVPQPAGGGNLRSLSGISYKNDDVVFVYTGRLGPEKNLPLLLRSFHKVSQEFHHARLLIVGDGPERDNLEDRTQLMGLTGVVHFTGQIPFVELPPYYSIGDVFVTPSTSETFGLTVVEAMASGLPVIGIDSPGISDNIQPGVTGFIAENTIVDFASYMRRLIVDPELRMTMAINARQESKHFSIEIAIDRLVDIYKKAILHRKNAANPTPKLLMSDYLDR